MRSIKHITNSFRSITIISNVFSGIASDVATTFRLSTKTSLSWPEIESSWQTVDKLSMRGKTHKGKNKNQKSFAFKVKKTFQRKSVFNNPRPDNEVGECLV